MAHHYIDSGPDNVWLDNGFTRHVTPYGEGMSIRNSAGLHQAIGRWLIALTVPLKGAELRFLRLEMELTQRDLAAILGTEEQAVRRWEKARGKALANGAADRLLRALYAEFSHGDSSVRQIAARLAKQRANSAQAMHFHETGHGWQVIANAA